MIGKKEGGGGGGGPGVSGASGLEGNDGLGSDIPKIVQMGTSQF